MHGSSHCVIARGVFLAALPISARRHCRLNMDSLRIQLATLFSSATYLLRIVLFSRVCCVQKREVGLILIRLLQMIGRMPRMKLVIGLRCRQKDILSQDTWLRILNTSGHMGILDFDCFGISAGMANVNRHFDTGSSNAVIRKLEE